MTFKPCPFCGQLDILIEQKKEDGRTSVRAFCLNCGCGTAWIKELLKGDTYQALEWAVKAWNRRAKDD